MRFSLSLAPPVKCALVIGAAYASVVCIGPYGVNDDYQYLYRTYAGIFDPAHNEQVGMGRPLASWLLDAGFKACGGSVAHLVGLRLAALAGVIGLAVALNRVLVRAGYGAGAALVVALLACLSPAGGVYAAWAAGFLSPYALLLCLWAGVWLETPDARPARWPRVIGASLLILLACGIWQAAVPMALFVSFAAAWKRREAPVSVGSARNDDRRWLAAWAVVGLSAVAYLIAQRTVIRLGWVPAAGTERMTLAADWSGKGRFLGEMLRAGFTSWARFQPAPWQWLAAGITASGVGLSMLARHAGGRIDRAATTRRGALAMVMGLASVSPLLIASENSTTYRTLPVLYTVVALLAVEGFGNALRRVPARTRNFLGGAVIAAVGLCAHWHVLHGIVEPNFREYTGVRREVRRQFQQMPVRVVYLPPPPTLLSGGWLHASGEYGLVSSPFWWVTKPFLLLVFHDLGMTPANGSDPLQIAYREAGNAGVPVIHPLPALLRDPGRWRDDPRWGKVQAFRGGWLYSPWFGYFNLAEFPVIQHHLLGSMLSIAENPRSIWLYKDGLGEFLTSAETFPNLYLNGSKEWVFLTDDDSAHCAIRDDAGVHPPLNQARGDRSAQRAAENASARSTPGRHPAFFQNEAALDNGVYYLRFDDKREFGYYSYRDFPYLYHFDLGFLYFKDAHDLSSGCYLYDFQGLGWFYTNPKLYPYLYNVDAKAFYYYFQGTKNPRSFVNMNTHEYINK